MNPKHRHYVYNVYHMVKYAIMLRCEGRDVTNEDIRSTLADVINKFDFEITSDEYSELVTMLQRRFDTGE